MYLTEEDERQVAAWVMTASDPLELPGDVVFLKCEILVCLRRGLEEGFDVRLLDQEVLREHTRRIRELVRRLCASQGGEHAGGV
jgi:hypothetical protein